jgi:hypothetical protein
VVLVSIGCHVWGGRAGAADEETREVGNDEEVVGPPRAVLNLENSLLLSSGSESCDDDGTGGQAVYVIEVEQGDNGIREGT